MREICILFLHNYEYVTNCIEQSPSSEANGFSPGQEFPRLLQNPKIRYCVPKNRRMYSVLF
jgi:hypothetical protein